MSATTYVVLLRGVNLGPHRRVTAAELRQAAHDAGLCDARTHANSGNLVAVAPERDANVAGRVSDALEHLTGTRVPAVALSADRLDEIVAANPFRAAARTDPAHLQVHVGAQRVDEVGIARFDLSNRGRELFAVGAGALFVHYADGIGTSRVTTDDVDRAAGTRTTARNWNTITRLLTMARQSAAVP